MVCYSDIPGVCEGMRGFEVSYQIGLIAYLILPPLIISGVLRLILLLKKINDKKSNIISIITFFILLIFLYIFAFILFAK